MLGGASSSLITGLPAISQDYKFISFLVPPFFAALSIKFWLQIL